MTQITTLLNKTVQFKDEGEGTPLVFLHGYLETLKVWDQLAHQLSKNYRVIRIDLPGHGGSEPILPSGKMDLMADSIKEVLDHLGISSCFLFGHSMGGYATLAFIEKFPTLIKGFSLVHSAPFADTDEKRNNRDREIKMLEEEKKELLINSSIPKMFADDNLEKLHEQVEIIKHQATTNSSEGIISVLRGMKDRPDRTNILKHSNIPCLWFLGKRDNHIDFDTVFPKVKEISPQITFEILDHSGHIGFIEQEEKVVNAITGWVNKHV